MYYSKVLLNSTQLNEHLWTQVLKHLNVLEGIIMGLAVAGDFTT